MPLTASGVVARLAALPEEKHLRGFKIHRVAKVHLHWNEERQDWDWEEPDGISDYRQERVKAGE